MISPIEEMKLKAELVEIEKELGAAALQMEEAASHGDLRENDPYHIAKAKYVSLMEQANVKKAQLNEPVGLPVGSAITTGRLLEVTYLGLIGDRGEMREQSNEQMILMFGESGDSVLQGVLSVHCDLGRQVLNGREGVFKVSTGSGVRLYDVRIFRGDPEEYFAKYPASKREKIERLLRGELA